MKQFNLRKGLVCIHPKYSMLMDLSRSTARQLENIWLLKSVKPLFLQNHIHHLGWLVDKWRNQCGPNNVGGGGANRRCKRHLHLLRHRQLNCHGTIRKWAVFQCLDICRFANPKRKQLWILCCLVATLERSRLWPCIANCHNWLRLGKPIDHQLSTVCQQRRKEMFKFKFPFFL